ncbi:sensor histidine kinase [Fictibacillus sp. Mic-4]|uniref:sensor histidine kinase n=1 Tax=Fictibacillus TaxID=1329200 RepID=UPI00040AC782|nr:sensor histidine kinase [Fictibacillus gelatini]
MEIIIYRALLLALVAFCLIFKGIPTSIEMGFYLLLFILEVLKAKYIKGKMIIFAEIVAIAGAVYIEPLFTAALGFFVFEIVESKRYALLIGTVVPAFFLLKNEGLLFYFFYIIVCVFVSYLIVTLKEKDAHFKVISDKERRYIYELESTKQQLLRSSQELVHMTELRERNRIASEIHDSIGHKIAGIYMQLQAAYKVKEKNEEKANALFEKTIGDLSTTLEVIRETVHNIKPKEAVGIEQIERIIQSFTFCDVSFTHKGDMTILSPTHWEVITTNIKEALTNAFKYSNASLIEIDLTTNDHFARLYIKDNGVGAAQIVDGLGMRGMKERVKMLGGSLSASGENGFMMVCILPIEKKEGDIFAHSNR